MKIAISLVNCNGISMLKPCIETLLASDINKHELHLYYWDNGSTDGSFEFVNSLNIPKTVVHHQVNHGIVGPRIELGDMVMASDCTHMLELHSDMRFPSLWFAALTDGHEDAGISMPTILQYRWPSSQDELEQWVAKYRGNDEYPNCLQTHPWLVNVSAMRDVGYYKREYIGMICEDDDFTWRMINSKHTVRGTNKSVVLHFGGATGGSRIGNTHRAFQVFHQLNGITRDDYYNPARYKHHPATSPI